MKSLFFIGGDRGNEVARWLLAHYPEDIALAVVPSEEDPCHATLLGKAEARVFTTEGDVGAYIEEKGLSFEYGFLLWFGPVLHEPLLSCPKNGFISMHPALLPFTRGANFNIWPIVEEAPFGVSLFKVNDIKNGIDTGDIVLQRKIPYTWLDNGQTLREKALAELAPLFMEAYPLLREGVIQFRKQDLGIGTTHYKCELEDASRIDLDARYRARDLLNWLRARTHPDYPGCWFRDGGERYEVRIFVQKAEKNG